MTRSMTPALNLNYTHKQYSHGDITVYITWTLHDERPCIVLLPSFVPIDSDHLIPCIVPMELAWIWDETTGDPAHCAHSSFQFAQALGFNEYNPQKLIEIASIIRSHLGDLLTVPPFPLSEKQVVADALLTDINTGKTREAEVTDYVH